jgi:hypothetical protein
MATIMGFLGFDRSVGMLTGSMMEKVGVSSLTLIFAFSNCLATSL